MQSEIERAEALKAQFLGMYKSHLSYRGALRYKAEEAKWHIRAYEMMTAEEILMTEKRVLERVHEETDKTIKDSNRAHESSKHSKLVFGYAVNLRTASCVTSMLLK